MTAVVADQLPDADAICALFARLAAELGLGVRRRKNGHAVLVAADGARIESWRENYPYPARLDRKAYEPAKRLLQIELLKLQRSVKSSGGRILILFEGRDAAGKGGTIRRFTENLNPRGRQGRGPGQARRARARRQLPAQVPAAHASRRRDRACWTGPGTTGRASSR